MHTYTIHLDSPYAPTPLVVDAEFMNVGDDWTFIEFTVAEHVVAIVKAHRVVAVTKKVSS